MFRFAVRPVNTRSLEKLAKLSNHFFLIRARKVKLSPKSKAPSLLLDFFLLIQIEILVVYSTLDVVKETL